MRFSLFMVLASLAFSHAGTYRGIKARWCFDLSSMENPDWMSIIIDDVPLSSLSIPGTHSSMTDKVENGFLQTQNAPLAQQLASGIRYIDITCRYINDEMRVYKGLVDTGYSLKDVLTTMFDFLDKYPSEAIILRIQKGGILDDSKTFLDSMKMFFEPGSKLGDRALQHVYFRDPDDTTIPTLGQTRGKVLVLQDFKTAARYGIPWNSNTVSSYSKKLAPSSLLLSLYWSGVKSRLSRDRSKDIGKLRITHTSASFGVKPIHIAAKKDYGYGMNRYLGVYLMENRGDYVGIVVMDFPDYNLVEYTLMLNRQYLALISAAELSELARIAENYRATIDARPSHDDPAIK
ncbi:1-phosphatidylinositol phosphodiesterase [Ceratocystis lukuohia]|uniref:1-phosphatidylinositol phosphodiesterase n=1 Tax=Ceratocystis lukuohia TaxID=2019550 RepID=A0ABR4MA54_9PEZI